jgi:uncharacterized membrane protein YGL010W
LASGADYFAEYASFHKDARNVVCHEIGIPLIVMSIFTLLSLVVIGPINLAIVAGVVVLLFYFTLDVKTALVATVYFTLLYLASRWLAWPYAIGTFVIGWILQFVGHGFEGRKPAFFKNVVHLLVGPLWICRLVLGPPKEG